MDSTLAANEYRYNKNLESLRTELSRCRDEFILEHFRKYDTPEFPPSWKTLEVASFGTLSKLYNNMNDFNLIYPTVQPSMMGFPRGWENEPLWQ